MPCECEQWACEQLPLRRDIPFERSIRLSLLEICSTRLCSKVISPVEKSISASFTAISWRAVGSYVSGDAPFGTSTSTSKSPHVTSSTSDFRGVMVTKIVGLSDLCSVLPHPIRSEARSANIVILRIIVGYIDFINTIIDAKISKKWSYSLFLSIKISIFAFRKTKLVQND